MKSSVKALLALCVMGLMLSGCVAGKGGGSATPVSAAKPGTFRSVLEQDNDLFQDTWNDARPELEKAITVQEKMQDAPGFALFGDSKGSLKKDFNEILNELSLVLTQGRLIDYQNKMTELRESIAEEKQNISKFKELRIGAPVKHVIKTTKTGYDKKVADAHENIAGYEGDMDVVRHQFSADLKRYGIELSADKADVLLSRVDADDIVGMTVAFDAVKAITGRLMELTDSTGENLEYAKRYYGMHVVLLELMIHMQNRYIDHVDNKYLPSLEGVRKKTREVNAEARQELQKEKDANRRNIYQANIKAHALTLKVADIYAKTLHSQRSKVLKARQKIERDRALARNTLKTVMVSAELLSILKSSQDSFNALINLQVPELVPFENVEMRKKFEELTTLMQNGGS
ncbi:MAG: hypothetical protein HQL54_04490 [Magnetococcales bacterium]|nr:hypothetical protein [Magnetococcales bacterium]